MTTEAAYKIKVLRNGGCVTELQWEAGSAPVVDVDAEAEIKSSFQGTFLENAEFDMLKDELQPVMTIDGTEQPLGVYRCATASISCDGTGRKMKLEAYDRCWRLQNTRAENVLHFNAGKKYVDVILQLLAGAGIVLAVTTDSAAVLPADREDWDVGTDYLSIINQLLSEIGYRPLWFDAFGYAHIDPYTAPDSTAIIRQYSSRDISRLPMAPEYSEETDLFDAPNVFICICSNADRTTALTATSVNDSPVSRKSVSRRGMQITEVVKVDQAADQAALQAYADKLKFESMLETRTVQFAVSPDASHGMWDIIAVDHPDIGGIYLETGWRMTLEAGEEMTVRARRTVIE